MYLPFIFASIRSDFSKHTQIIEEALHLKVVFVNFCLIQDNLAQPQMMVVSDISDVFVPLVDGFLVDVKKAKVIVDRYVIPKLNWYQCQNV